MYSAVVFANSEGEEREKTMRYDSLFLAHARTHHHTER